MWTTPFLGPFSLIKSDFFESGHSVDNYVYCCGEKCGKIVDLWRNVDNALMHKMYKYANIQKIIKK